MVPHINVAIDGPAGAGKSTVARKLAEKLGNPYIYVDTGALYRGITYQAQKYDVDIQDQEQVLALAEQMKMDFDSDYRLWIDGVLRAEEIRTPEVSRNVSIVAAYAGIRQYVLEFLKQLAMDGGVVMDGRDIGMYVLPNAEVKIFLTASIDERAARRMAELQGKNYALDIETMKKEIQERDDLDTGREISPLVQAPDAILIDTTNLQIDEVVEKIYEICRRSMRDAQ